MKAVLQTLRGDLIDELGEIEEKLKPLQKLELRAEHIKREMREQWAHATPAGQAVSFEGQKYTVLVSPKQNETKPDKPGLFKFLGLNRFIALARFTLSDLRDEVPSNDLAKFLKQDRTGSRSVSVAPRPQQAKVRKAHA